MLQLLNIRILDEPPADGRGVSGGVVADCGEVVFLDPAEPLLAVGFDDREHLVVAWLGRLTPLRENNKDQTVRGETNDSSTQSCPSDAKEYDVRSAY